MTPYSVDHWSSAQYYWASVCKTVRPMLSDRCPVCSICNVGVLWPNGWMDQNETWHRGRPRPRPHCARWKPSSPKTGHSLTQFSVHVRCGPTAGWIKMPLRTEVGLSPGDIVLDGDPAPPPKKKKVAQPPIFGPCLLWPNGWMGQDVTWYGCRPQSRRHCVICVRWGSGSPSLKRHNPLTLGSRRCRQTAGWTKMPLGVEVGLGSGDCVRWRPSSLQKGQPHPIFGPCLLWPNGWMDQCATWYGSRPRPRQRCVRWGPFSLPRAKGNSSSPTLYNHRRRWSLLPAFCRHIHAACSIQPSVVTQRSCRFQWRPHVHGTAYQPTSEMHRPFWPSDGV